MPEKNQATNREKTVEDAQPKAVHDLDTEKHFVKGGHEQSTSGKQM